MARKTSMPRLPETWSAEKGMLVKAAEGTKRLCRWEPYTASDRNHLFLEVKVKIWMNFAYSQDSVGLSAIEKGRRKAWLNAADMAEVLVRNADYPGEEQYAVFFHPKGTYGSQEDEICIYRKF